MSPNTQTIPEFHKGDRLAKARQTIGLTQAQMADEIGVSRRSLGKWEDTGVVKKSTLLLYSMRTGVPVQWLETGEAPGAQPGPGLPGLDSNQEPIDFRRAVVRASARRSVPRVA